VSKHVLASMTIFVLAAACTAYDTGTRRDAVSTPVPTFLHQGFGAGPVIFTDAGGYVLEERRYEPFGTPVGTPDLVARDLNPLNKRTDPATGWSDHGARWLAPETGRWHSPDPIVVGPDATFMAMPWALHPYQYVHQNPVAFWDPDGKCASPIIGTGQIGICIEAFIATSNADRIWGIPVGVGDGRGFAPNDPQATYRIRQLITFDPKTGLLTSGFNIAHSHALLLSFPGTGSSRLTLVPGDGPGRTFIAGARGVNGFSRFPGGPDGSIDYAFKFHIDNEGNVSLVSGVHKGFPSYAAYAYKRGEDGRVTSTTLHESKENVIRDLQDPFDGRSDDPPGNLRNGSVQIRSVPPPQWVQDMIRKMEDAK